MAHNRNLLIGGVALVMGKLKGDGPAMVDVCDELDPLLVSIGFFNEAPFKCVSLIIRYGLVNNTKPEYQPIIKRHGELPVAIELDMTMLKSAAKNGSLKSIFLLAMLEVLIDVGNRYHLPIERLVEERDALISSSGINFSQQGTHVEQLPNTH